MTGLLPALFGALIVVGLLGVLIASRPHTPQPRPQRTPSALGRRLGGLSPRTRVVLLGSVGCRWAAGGADRVGRGRA